MNPTKLSAVSACALIALAGTLSNLNAAEVTLTDGAGIDWFGYRSNTATVFTYENGTTTMTNLDKDSYVWGYLPQKISLSAGESVTLTGTAVFKSVTSGSAFYFGLYNSGANTKPAAGTSFMSIVAGTYDMTGFFAGTKSSTDNVVTNVYSRFSGKATTQNEDGTTTRGAGFMDTGQGASYISNVKSAQSLTHPVAGEAYDFSLKILRTLDGYEIQVGDLETVSFGAEKSFSSGTFDVIGMKSPGTGITLSNLSISTTGTIIPESSAFCIMGGGLFFALALCSRRRRRKT